MVLRHSHITAVFVNMAFSNKDKILTKPLTSGRFDYGCVKGKGMTFQANWLFLVPSPTSNQFFSEPPKTYRNKKDAPYVRVP